ncbi:hypothetical protein GCM10025880_22100 [Methylorubrum aminovorans]|nr:hypothetical protein GCM10025880_22100 [Methylorubrum aminovorans]
MLLRSQQAREQRRGVEARHAQPVDAAVAPDQGGGAAVSDQGVILDPSRHPGLRRRARAERRGGYAGFGSLTGHHARKGRLAAEAGAIAAVPRAKWRSGRASQGFRTKRF